MSKPTIILAPDKFRGSFSAGKAVQIMDQVISEMIPGANVISLPLGDGGEGTGEILGAYLGAEFIPAKVKDPLFREVDSGFYLNKKKGIAVIEMALASGLRLVKEEERKPLLSTTYGTGELIAQAIQKHARQIYLCAGGSATHDCGIGMAAALGMEFLDSNHEILPPNGRSLPEIAFIEDKNLVPEIRRTKINLLWDVKTPLYGPQGAAVTYGPQKGANPAEINLLDRGSKNIASLVSKKYLMDLQQMTGAGSAGGLGAGAIAFLGAQPVSGINALLNLSRFGTALEQADFVITGEGKLDVSSFEGKTVGGVCEMARRFDKPVYVLCGENGVVPESLKDTGIRGLGILSMVAGNTAQSLELPEHWLAETFRQLLPEIIDQLKIPVP